MDVLNKIYEPMDIEINPLFKQFIDDHVEYFLANNLCSPRTISGLQQGKYVGDFEGLLLDMGVPRSLFYLTLRVNRLSSSLDWKGEATAILVPSESEHRLLREIFDTTA